VSVQPQLQRPFLIGIAGGSGSGKSKVAATVCRWFAPNALVLPQDCYYRDHPELSLEQRSRLNYDEPLSIDHALLQDHLQRLSCGRAIERPQYDFAVHRRRDQRTSVSAAEVVVVEGLFAWWDEGVREQFDLRVFVDADADLRFIRRLRRDVEERGRTIESVIRQYLETVRPMHEVWIEPARNQAHVVLPNSGAWENAEQILKQRMAARLPACLAVRLIAGDVLSGTDR
jgi:uridine kinase